MAAEMAGYWAADSAETKAVPRVDLTAASLARNWVALWAATLGSWAGKMADTKAAMMVVLKALHWAAWTAEKMAACLAGSKVHWKVARTAVQRGPRLAVRTAEPTAVSKVVRSAQM